MFCYFIPEIELQMQLSGCHSSVIFIIWHHIKSTVNVLLNVTSSVTRMAEYVNEISAYSSQSGDWYSTESGIVQCQ